MKVFLASSFISLALSIASRGQDGGTWHFLPDMPSARQELATAVLNGKVYVIAGINAQRLSTATVDVYNPATGVWTSAHPVPSATNHNAAAVAAGKLYHFGGTKSLFVYDAVNDSWSELAPPHYQHGATAAVGILNDKIYVAGGLDGFGLGNEVEVYDPATNTWTVLASMKVPRNHCAGGVINGKFYVAGGRGSTGAETAFEGYDPQANSWTTLPSLPTPRSGVAAGVVHGELFVIGGEVPGGVPDSVEAFNPATNSWRKLQHMTAGRHGIWGSVIGNKIYIEGGADESPYGPVSLNEVLVVNSAGTFANISTRLKVGTGDNVLIGGFIVSGTASKRILLRALGPSVPLSGALANPRLELYNGSNQLIATNDNWKDAPNKQEIIDSALAPSNDSEAAILTNVPPGNYTAVVSGAGGSTGVALVEVYDLEAGSECSLANISTRGFVQTGDDILIAGLIFDGQLSRRTMVRAIGPSLRRADALADPQLELRDANGGLVAENDNWTDAPNKQEIIDSLIPPSNNSESAILQTLPPARYTAIVRGVNNTVGLALVEAYALQ
ncbi:MAG: hypothetical protein M3N12_09480 [Verrucomicrobiota bacterium]|nr:hypothetical protein [Verrucomicrobiota bacterium]